MSPTTFEFVSIDKYCSEVSSLSQVLLPENRNVIFYVYEGEVSDIIPIPSFYPDSSHICLPQLRVLADKVFLASLENVNIQNNTFLILLEKHLALGNSYHSPFEAQPLYISTNATINLNNKIETLRLKLYDYNAPDISILEPCVLLSSFNHENYFHWIFEVISRLWCFDLVPELLNMQIIIPGQLNSFQREILDALGLSTCQLLPFPGNILNIKKLYFPSFLAPRGYSKRQIDYVRDKLLKAFGINRCLYPSRRYYVSRRGASKRRILNEEDVIKYLQQYDFEIIYPNEMSVKQQIEAFSSAEIVVAPHGAGNANMLFAPESATLIELLPKSYQELLFWWITSFNKQLYGRIICDDDPETKDMVVDIEKLAVIIE